MCSSPPRRGGASGSDFPGPRQCDFPSSDHSWPAIMVSLLPAHAEQSRAGSIHMPASGALLWALLPVGAPVGASCCCLRGVVQERRQRRDSTQNGSASGTRFAPGYHAHPTRRSGDGREELWHRVALTTIRADTNSC
jgi:hypothetical protein